MMLNKLLTVAAAMLLPAALAIPTSGASSNPQAPAQGVSPLVAEAMTGTTDTAEFEAGRCRFEARVEQQCDDSGNETSITIPYFLDNAGKVIVRPAHGRPVYVNDEVWQIEGLGQDFWASVQDGVVSFTYGETTWTDGQSHDKTDLFSCSSSGWSSDTLACSSSGLPESRFLELSNCAFQCGPQKPTSTNQARTVASALDLDPVGEVSPVDGGTEAPSYAHGYCSFKMQLFNQCTLTSEEGWHSEMLGMLYSMEDNNRKTVVTYPNGIGRIDRGAIRLLGMGDFRIAYSNDDKQVYFAFDGGWWATNTKDDGHAYGLCRWGSWTQPDLVCSPGNGMHSRISDLGCIFKC